jgi:hypothetical protein
MPARPRRPRDPNELAFQVFQEAIGEAPRQAPPIPDDSPAAVAKRKGASRGGKITASKLTAEARSAAARKAALARWRSRKQ